MSDHLKSLSSAAQTLLGGKQPPKKHDGSAAKAMLLKPQADNLKAEAIGPQTPAPSTADDNPLNSSLLQQTQYFMQLLQSQEISGLNLIDQGETCRFFESLFEQRWKTAKDILESWSKSLDEQAKLDAACVKKLKEKMQTLMGAIAKQIEISHGVIKKQENRQTRAARQLAAFLGLKPLSFALPKAKDTTHTLAISLKQALQKKK